MKPSFLTNKTKSRTRLSAKVKTTSKTKTKAKPNTKRTTSTNTPPKRRLRSTTTPTTPASTGIFSRILKYSSIFLITLLAIGTLLYIMRDQWGISSLINTRLPATHKPDPEKYTSLTAALETDRLQFKSQYLNATSNTQKQHIINTACALLEKQLPELMRCWLGHPWDFNGTATIPGEGKIACGYYVSTIMRDAGFKIDRIRVAQQPSQNIIRTFVNTSKNYEIKTNTPYPNYIQHITKKYEGIHIVGLDKHVAFIVIKNGKMRFIHSGGVKRCVVDEGVDDAYALEHSNYRVISNISRNPDVIKKWILGQKFKTGGTH